MHRPQHTQLLSACLLLLCAFSTAKTIDKCKAKQPTTPEVLASNDYDFIIVGGGTAGSILATRLSENPDWTVLLIESGRNTLGDNGESMDKSMREMFGVEYCVPGETQLTWFERVFKACPMQSLPVHFSMTPFMALYMSMIDDSYYYQTTPQIYANKREISYPRGNLLGGSSATNTMVSFRGHPPDFNEAWAKTHGLQDWTYDDVLPYYKKLETNHDFAGSKYHGTEGPIHWTNVSSHHHFPILDTWLQTAWEKMGVPKVADFANPNHYYGAGYWQSMVTPEGRRSSAYSYVDLARKAGRVCFLSEEHTRADCQPNQNLHIVTEKFVIKILTDENKRAVGVEYVDAKEHKFRASRPYRGKHSDVSEAKKSKHLHYWDDDSRHPVQNCPVDESVAFDYKRKGNWYIPPFNRSRDLSETEVVRVTAKREVILSAGAANSPQLLMLSGIGPQLHLSALGIDVVQDLPVGNHLEDHEEVAMSFKLPKDYKKPWSMVTDMLDAQDKWIKGKKSPLAANHVPGGMDISSKGPGSEPTVHVHFAAFYFENLDMTMWKLHDKEVRLPTSLLDFPKYNGLHYYTLLLERTGSCSDGSVRLRSTDPFQPPFLDFGYGSCKYTNDELTWAVKEMRRLNDMLPHPYKGEEVWPGEEVQTDEEIVEWIRNFIWGHHMSGSVPMGTCDSVDAVLDNKARVFGVPGLRVVDASVFPSIPSGNIAASVMMVAEKISDSIKNDWGVTTTTITKTDKPIFGAKINERLAENEELF